MENVIQNQIPENQIEQPREGINEHNSEIGPLELNLLERIENGLNISDHEIDQDSKFSTNTEKENKKFEGQQQVISVSGWASIQCIYEKYTIEFIFKIILGFALIYCMSEKSKSLTPISIVFVFFAGFYFFQSAFKLKQNWQGNTKIRMIFWIDLNIALCYSTYFLGFLLYLSKKMSVKHLPLFSFPYLVFSVFLLFQPSDEHPYLNQKRFLIIESLQLFLITLKIAQIVPLNWSYTIFILMASSIYITVIGFFLSMILSCSFTGLIYQNIYKWKLFALIWMTWYYLSTGIVYIHLIKGFLKFYHDEGLGFYESDIQYNDYREGSSESIVISGVCLVVLSTIALFIHLLWRKEIQRFLLKVIYKNEVRKEVTLRFLTKSFTFKLIQVSATYFLKSEKMNDQKKGEVEKSIEGKNVNSKIEKETCLFCCEKEPEIMIDPCGHGGVCRECIVNYLKGNVNKCPFCKGKVEKVFLVETEGNKQQFIAKGEIVFKN